MVVSDVPGTYYLEVMLTAFMYNTVLLGQKFNIVGIVSLRDDMVNWYLGSILVLGKLHLMKSERVLLVGLSSIKIPNPVSSIS